MLSARLEFTYTVELDAAIDVGPTAAGRRLIYPVLGGKVRGDRLHGEVLAGGADWMTAGADGWAELDVRAELRLHDGAVVTVAYTGVLEMTPAIRRGPGTDTTFDDQYFRCSPTLRTGASAHSWVNRTLFVSRGRMTTTGVAYEVYRVD